MAKEKSTTKLCKHCKTEIPVGAKVCPQCRKKQGGGCLTKILIVLVVIIAIGVIASFGENDEPNDNKASNNTTSTSQNHESTTEVTQKSTTKKEKAKTPSQIVDDIIRSAREDAKDASNKDLKKALSFIKENIDTCYESDENMKNMIYYGYLLNYKYGDGTTEGDAGFDAAQAAKNVYRGTDDVNSDFVKENIRQVKEGLGLSDKSSDSDKPTESSSTTGQQNALSKAESYLAYSPFSYNGLIEQLEYEGFTNEEATYAADNCGADWTEQANKKAVSYLSFSSFSYSGLIEQLEYEGYTNEEATSGADNCGADWNEQAAKKAQSYMDYSSFSRDSLIDQLKYEGFTDEQAEYGASAVGY